MIAPSRAAAMPASVRALVRACHPEPTAGVTALATGLAAAAGASAARAGLVAVTVLTGQLSIGWSNDVIDRARDTDSGRADKPLATGALDPRVVRTAAAVALVAALVLSPLAGWAAGLASWGVVGGGWAYNLGLKRTAWSWAPYAFAFGLLPAYVVLALPGTATPPAWLVAAGALLGVGAHFFNVLPDLADDRATGVRSLPVRLGATGSRGAGCLCLLGAALALVLGPPGAPGAGAVAALALAAALAVAAALSGMGERRSRAPFLLALLAAGVDLGLLVALVDRGTALS